MVIKINPFHSQEYKFKTEENILNFILNFILQNVQKQTAPLESTAQ